MATLPAPSVRSVLDLAALGLVLRAGSARRADGSDRPVRWVAVSELEDPTAFLEGEELLLSTGMRLRPEDPAAVEEYVRRLVGAGVAAYGLGVGLTHLTVPAALLEAAEAHGLVVLEVPDRTPFIAVSKAVSSMVAAQEYESTTRAFEIQRDLTRAALGAGAVDGVASRLARGLAAWVLVLDPSGRLVASAPPDANDRALALRPELEVLQDKGLRASVALDLDGDRVALHPLGARGTVRGYLAVGRATPFDPTDTALVAVAVSLLSLAQERSGAEGPVGERVQDATLQLLLAGADADRLPLAALGWDWLTQGAIRVVRAPAGSGPGLPSGPDRAVGRLGSELVVLVADREPALQRLDEALRAAGLCAGGSGPTTLTEPNPAYVTAGRALRARVEPGIEWQDRMSGQGLLRLVDPAAGRAFAEAVLAPLRQAKGDLLASLLAWLAHNGQWDVAAQDLGVHRHTLRYRMRRVEELLGRTLDDAGLRAELWYALELLG